MTTPDEGEDEDTDTQTVTCHNCGYHVVVDGPVYLRHTSIEESAKARRAGHIGGGCPPEEVEIK